MASRVELPLVVLNPNSPYNPVAGATCTITDRATGKEAKVYANSGATEETIAQPLSTDSAGRLTGWMNRGAYECTITIPGQTPYSEPFDAASAKDGGIDTAWLAGEAVTSEKISSTIKDAAAATPSLRSLGTSSTSAAAGNDSRLSDERIPQNNSVTASKIGPEAVEPSKIKEKAVETAKIKDEAVTYAKLTPEQRGYAKSLILGEETSSKSPSGGFVWMPTPDRVEITLPEKGIVHLAYLAQWKGTNFSRAAIFGNKESGGDKQLTFGGAEGFYYYPSAAGEASSGANWKVLSTFGGGLMSVESTSNSESFPTNRPVGVGSIATTGQGFAYDIKLSSEGTTETSYDSGIEYGRFMAGHCSMWLSAGTWQIGVKYGAAAGHELTNIARERHLYVWTREFV